MIGGVTSNPSANHATAFPHTRNWAAGTGRGRLLELPQERAMFFWFLVAVAVVVGLTLLGAFISRRSPGTSWQNHEDTPMGLGGDHFH
jgi:hypothetical protein